MFKCWVTEIEYVDLDLGAYMENNSGAKYPWNPNGILDTQYSWKSGHCLTHLTSNMQVWTRWPVLISRFLILLRKFWNVRVCIYMEGLTCIQTAEEG